MKYLVVLLALCLAAVSAINEDMVKAIMEEMKRIAEKCIEDNNAPPETINELMAHSVPASHEGKCAVFCIHQHIKLQKADGSVDKENAMALVNEIKEIDPDLHKKVLKVFVTCEARVKIESDPCITAANLAQCALDEYKAVGINLEFILE